MLSGTEGGGAGFGGTPPPYTNFAPVITDYAGNTAGISGVAAFQAEIDAFYAQWYARQRKQKRSKKRDAITAALKAAWKKRLEEERDELLLLLGFDILLFEDEIEDE